MWILDTHIYYKPCDVCGSAKAFSSRTNTLPEFHGEAFIHEERGVLRAFIMNYDKTLKLFIMSAKLQRVEMEN